MRNAACITMATNKEKCMDLYMKMATLLRWFEQGFMSEDEFLVEAHNLLRNEQ